MYTEEELKKLFEDEDELTEEELVFLLAALDSTLTTLENELRNFYSRFGKDGVVTYSEVRKWVSSNNHLKRLVLLNQTISDVFEQGFDSFEKSFIDHLTDIIEKESNFFGVKLDVDEILDTLWGEDESNFIQRLLKHRHKWTLQLNNDLKISIIKRDSILDVLTQVGNRGKSMETILKRLWRTESNAVSSIARKKIYEELGITKYRFIHTDACDCEKCNNLHNQVFPIAEYMVGVTANPLHPNCKDTTIPVE